MCIILNLITLKGVFMKNNSLKSAYRILFILGIIETILIFFPGNLLAAAVFITALKVNAKSKKYNSNFHTSKGIKFLLAGSIIHFISFIILLSSALILIINGAHSSAFYLLRTLGDILCILIFFSFILLIPGCIFTYREYKVFVEI